MRNWLDCGLQESVMPTKCGGKQARSRKPLAVGMGLVALDVVFTSDGDVAPRCYAGGTCGNVLTILSYLGWRALPVSRLRADRPGERLVQELQHWGVSTEFVTQSPDGRTPVIVQRIRCAAGAVPRHSFSWRCPSCGAHLPGYKPVLASDIEATALAIPHGAVFFFDRVSRSTLLMAKISRKRGAVVVFEPASVGEPALFKEAWELSHIVKYSHERLREMAELGRGQTGGSGVLIEIETMGGDGLRYRSRLPQATSGWVSVGAYPISDIKDTSGAGDWCTAGLLNALATNGATGLARTNQAELRTAIENAQALAAWNCRFEGARGGMYRYTRVQLSAAVERIVRGATAASSVDVDGVAERWGDLAELCHTCNEQTSTRGGRATPARRSGS